MAAQIEVCTVQFKSDGDTVRGYVALAVDLYRSRVTTEVKEAHELIRGLLEDRSLRDL